MCVYVYEEERPQLIFRDEVHNCKRLGKSDSADGVGQYVGESEESSS